MEAASQSRKDKLLALRKRKADEEAGLIAPGTSRVKLRGAPQEESELDIHERQEREEREKKLKERKFRNYDVETGQAKIGTFKDLNQTVEMDIDGLQQSVLAADEIARAEELDLLNIAPRKPNWDLKRDMQRRLAKLERRDKESRLILLRQRISSQKGAGADGQLSALQAEMTASALQSGNAGDLDGEEMASDASDEED